MRVYLSGGITGVKNYKKKFEVAEKMLKEAGLEVVNPAKIITENNCYSYIDYICADLKLLEKCEAIFMLENWNKSVGARLERSIALKLNKQIYYFCKWSKK